MTAPVQIIDDEAAIRRLVRGASERDGLAVDEAENAAMPGDGAARGGVKWYCSTLVCPTVTGSS